VKKSNNIPKPTHFGKNLKFLRRLKGLSQTAMAEKIGLSRNNIASYESGIVEPNGINFLATCEFFAIEPKFMLDTLLVDHPLDNKNGENEEPGVLDKYLIDQLDQFVIQTNEMTKVFEGYKAFFDMKKSSSPEKGHRELYATLEDLLDLLEKLIGSNWGLIQSVVPSPDEID
jgi:transcriptional regulator with XRE-family HTH domain